MHDAKPTDRSAFLLQALAEGIAATPGRDFFRHLTRSLATALELRYCFLAECLDAPASRVRTLAFCDGERMLDNFEYELAGTPCRRVLGGAECRFGEGVRALFPDDLDLEKLGAESYAALPLRNTWGQVIGHLAVLDTRPFRETEPDFALLRLGAARAGSELERLRLNERLARAQRLEVAGQLTNGLVHNFNNVLTAISGYAELLLGQLPAGDDRRSDCEEILGAAQRGRRLVEQIAAFGRRPLGPPRRLEFNGLLSEIVTRARQLLGENVELSTRFDTTPAEVFVDPALIEQVLITLLGQVRGNLPTGGRLTLTTQLTELGETSPWLDTGMTPGIYAACSITDSTLSSAPGTDRAAAGGAPPSGGLAPGGEHLFDPLFASCDGSTTLGLPTLFGAVRETGGNLVAEPAAAGGATLTLLVPIAEPGVDVASDRPQIRAPKTLLVVEDRAEVRRLLERMLERGGYQVLSASEAEEALAVGRNHPGGVALLITDVMMPGPDGWELGRRWREHQPEARILYISGSFDAARVETSRAAGTCGFLRKPFSSQKLLEKVAEILGQA